MAEEPDSSHLVRVCAQVMKRDDENDGWVAHGGGGLADVMVSRRRRPAAADSSLDNLETDNTTPPMEFFIHGNRVSDNAVMLECTIKKDFEYSKVMPTFHHWVTDEKRYGLAFQTAADARAFDEGVRTAIQEFLQGWASLQNRREDNTVGPKEENYQEGIFECLQLPMESNSSPENSAAMDPKPDDAEGPSAAPSNRPRLDSPEELDEIGLARALYDAQLANDADDLPEFGSDSGTSSSGIVAAGDSLLSSPSAPANRPTTPRDHQNQGIVTKSAGHTLPVPTEKRVKKRLQNQCKQCHEWYLESDNQPGACELAPDCFRSCVDTVSCMKAARCVNYHCLSEAEGDTPTQPCDCTPTPPSRMCFKRWAAMALLSLIAPCLCLYPPLNCLNMCTRRYGISGAAHVPIFNTHPPGVRNPVRPDI